MSNTFTTEDLLQYLYNEMSPETSRLLEQELSVNSLLRAQLEELRTSSHSLDTVLESPRTETVLNILRYARDTAPAGSH